MPDSFPPQTLLKTLHAQLMPWGEILCPLLGASVKAARAILNARQNGLLLERKEDGSPVTNADKHAQDILFEEISKLPQPFSALPLVSEEFPPLPPASEKGDFWLIDPLDGTKGFISGQEAFCINIALLRDGVPVAAIVSVPAMGAFYLAAEGKGAWKTSFSQPLPRRLSCGAVTTETIREKGLRILGSSRKNSEAKLYAHLRQNRGNPPIASLNRLGSAVKILQIAEGNADYYYQPGPTMAWDIAAPQLILEEAGGTLCTLDFQRLSYGKGSWKNTVFEAIGTAENPFSAA